jgi:hypothetical protein
MAFQRLADVCGLLNYDQGADRWQRDDVPQLHAESHRISAIAIFDSFTTFKMNPPVGEGFSLTTGAPVLAIPRDGVVYLRSFGDDMKAALRAILSELRHGREHPNWLAWVRSFADWLPSALTRNDPGLLAKTDPPTSAAPKSQ